MRRFVPLALIIAACGDPSTQASSPDPVSPLSLSNAPAQSGARVFRGTTFFIFVNFDAEEGLALVLNGRDGIPSCGESFTVSHPAQWQDVISPQDEILIQDLLRTDGAFAHLYAWNGVFPETDAEFCALVTGARIGRGRVRLVNTDNDLLAFLRDPIRTHSFGLAGSGRVDMSAGGTRGLTVVARFVVVPDQQCEPDPDAPQCPPKVNEVESIKLSPGH